LFAAKGREQKKAPLVPTSLGARTTCKARGLKINKSPGLAKLSAGFSANTNIIVAK
jgi:hypothetical protein